MKIKKLRIKNFQSVSDITLEFDEKGVVRFSGPNNVGKSVILKAISTVMLNVSNRNYKEFIRDEENTFEIRLEDFKGNWVMLSRGEVDFYKWSINGEDGQEDRTSGRVPLVVKEYFNLYVEDEKTNECMNIRLPDDTLLYVNTTPGDTAMMFQKALGTEDYLIGIKKVGSKSRELRKEQQLIEKYLVQENDKLKDAEVALHEEETKVDDIERYEDILKNENKKYKKIVDMEDATVEYLTIRKEVRDNVKALEELSLDSIKDDLGTLKKVTEFYEVSTEVSSIDKRLKEDKEKMEECDLDSIQQDMKRVIKMETVIELYTEVESLEDKISKSTVSVEGYGELDEDIAKVSRIEQVFDVAKELKGITEDVKKKKGKLEGLEKEIQEVEDELGYCPTCGSKFPHEH